MNCTQAQALLAAYREQHDEDSVITELDAHLEQCAACREVLARSQIIGERIRLLPPIEPAPALRPRLMEALAAEHARFVQRSSGTPAPPDFLKPYLHDHVRPLHKQHQLAAFSTAETGPLPILRAAKKTRSRAAMGQLAILGVAAMFFMLLMMGGITSLLLLAQNHVQPVPSSASVIHPTDVVTAAYTVTTPYDHVVSAVSNHSAIYYSAYSDGYNGGWMLERLDRVTMTSTPLLATPGQSPLIILGSTNNWLVWLQFDPAKATKQSGVPLAHSIVRPWSLYYLPLADSQASSASAQVPAPVQLMSGTFDENTAPGWLYSPIQGIWFIQNTLLVAALDNNSVSHLSSYALGSDTSKDIADAPTGAVITSPTANDNGSQIYWSQEWQTSDGVFHSNIWMQQTMSAPRATRGWATQQTNIVKEPFLEDSVSFHPVVVDDTLFFLSTASPDLLQGTQQTPGATATTTAALNASQSAAAMPITPGADIGVYPASLDTSIRGTILMYPLDDPTVTAPALVSSPDAAASLQAGKDFVLWQTDGGYGMYDAITRIPVTVGEVLNNAQFLAVNGNSTVWMVNTGQSNITNSVGSSQPITLKVFDWPR